MKFVRFAVAASSAVADWHECHGVHGRLRPQAFNVDRAGRHWLLAPRSMTQELAYLAPEQTGRLLRAVDERTDLYSLGVVLYRQLTGRLPFDALDALDWVHCHLARQPIPPSQVVPDLAWTLEHIVLRLLAKQPEERYQTARGLVADLEQCRAQLAETGHLTAFPLGQRDVPDRLVPTGRLYGRQGELNALTASFDRVAGGGSAELMCLAGDPGIGKSALITALAEPVALAGSRLLTVKFNGLDPTPFAMITQPLTELTGQLLAEPEERLAHWRNRLGGALGPTAGVMVELAPALAQIVGETASPTELPDSAARVRLQSTVCRLLAALADPGRPLVLALDDLHCADEASVELLEYVLTAAADGQLFIAATLRTGEAARHEDRLTRALTGLQRAGLASVTPVGPLTEAALAEVLADTLRTQVERVTGMAGVVADKTGANPLFVGQFLHRLREQGLLWFERRCPGWHWDLRGIAESQVTDNVVDLVAGRIDQQPPDVRDMLVTAALLGDRFDVATLCRVTGRPDEDVAACLHQAFQERLLQPIDSYTADAEDTADAPAVATYRWPHDRIRSAVWSRIPAEVLPARRLAIGRTLLAGTREREERLFDAVGHLNAAAALLTTSAERAEVAGLNLTAAGRAGRSGAHDAALAHARAGLSLLPPDAWSSQYDLALRLHLEAARSSGGAGDRSWVEELLDTAYANARTDLDRVDVVRLRLRLAIDHGELDRPATELGLRGLALLGFALPADSDACEPLANEALAVMDKRLAGLRVEDVCGAPQMTDEKAITAAEFVAELLAVTQADPARHTLLTVRGVELTLVHGLTDASAMIIAYYAAVAANRLADDTSRWCGQVAVRLIDKMLTVDSSPRLSGGACFIACLNLPMWYDGPEPTLALIRRGYRRVAEQGDLLMVGYLRFLHGYFQLRTGTPLDQVAAELDGSWNALRGSQTELARMLTRATDDIVAALREVPSAVAPARTPAELALLDLVRRGEFGLVSAPILSDTLFAAYLFGEYREALSIAETARRIRPLVGSILGFEIAFYHALTLTMLYADGTADERRAWAATLAELQATFEHWAARGPVIAAHKALLISAERARLDGDDDLATARYDQALGAACEYGFTHVEAITAELAARYARSRGELAEADGYLTRAMDAFHRWGAVAKVRQLEQPQHRSAREALDAVRKILV